MYIHHRVLCQTFTATCHCRGRDETIVPSLDDGRRKRLKHVEHFTEINKLRNVASCWLHLKIRLRCTDPWKSNLFLCSCCVKIVNNTSLCYLF